MSLIVFEMAAMEQAMAQTRNVLTSQVDHAQTLQSQAEGELSQAQSELAMAQSQLNSAQTQLSGLMRL